MKTYSQHLGLAAAMTAVLLSSGCRSGGSSKWAWWNPLSKAAEDTSLVARTAPELPSDAAQPMVEGTEAPPSALAAADLPDAAKTEAPAFPTPKIAAVTPPPVGDATPPATDTKPLPTITTPATTAVASTGPYDPEGYQPATPTTPVATTPTDRYGGDRYASTPAAETADFEFAPVTQAPANPTADRYGLDNRYATPTTLQTAAITTPPAAETPVASTTEIPSTQAPLVAETPPPNALADATYPTTPAASAVTPVPASAEQISTDAELSAKIGTLPAPSRYASSEAVAPDEEIQLTSLPGEYRPGGTGTFEPGVSVATRPGVENQQPAYPTSTPAQDGSSLYR